MATVDMSRVEFWEPPLAILSDKQRQAASRYCGNNFSLITSSRNHLAPPHTEAEGITCYSLDTTPYNDADASDYFPTIEEILGSVSYKEMRSEGHHDTEDLGANLDEPALDQSTRPPSLARSRSDHTTNDCEGTRKRPVILEDDDSDSTDAEDESETASTSSDLNAVDITQDSILDSTLLGRDASHPRALAPSADAGGDFERGYTPEDEQGLCTQPEPLVPASAISQPISPICATEAPPSPANQQSYNPSLHSRSEDIQRGSPFDALLESGEYLREKQQEWKKRARRGDGYKEWDAEDAEGGEDELPPEQKMADDDDGQQTIATMDPKVSNAIGDCLHDTSDEDDGDPRPAKRRRMLPASRLVSPATTGQNGPQPRLRWSSRRSSPVTRDNGLTHTENSHGSHPSADVGHSYPPHSSLSASPSIVAEATQTGGAEYHEWGLQHGSLKRTKIGEQTLFTLEFSLNDLHDLLALQASSHRPGLNHRATTPVRSAHPHRLAAQIKSGRPSKRQRGRRCTFTTDDDVKLVDLKEVQGLSWKDITLQFPGRSLGGLQVRYCTKLKNRRLSNEDDSVSED